MPIHQQNVSPIYKRFISASIENLKNAFLQTITHSQKKQVLQPLIVLIPSYQWYSYLQKQIAENSENQKISAGIQFELPANFFWSITQILIPNTPIISPFSKNNLRWIIYQIIKSKNPQEYFSEIAYWLKDSDDLAKFNFAEKTAYCFNDYRLYQSNLLDQWSNGFYNKKKQYEKFQFQLWQEILALVNKASAKPKETNSNLLYHWIEILNNPKHSEYEKLREKINCFYPNGIFWIGSIPLEQLASQYQHALNAIANATDVVEWLWQPKIEENINLPWVEDLQRVYQTDLFDEKYFNPQKSNILITSEVSHKQKTNLNFIKNHWQGVDKNTDEKNQFCDSLQIKKFTTTEEEVNFWGEFLINKILQKRKNDKEILADEINIYTPNISDYGGIINAIWSSLAKPLGFNWSKNTPFFKILLTDLQKTIESQGSAQAFWEFINNPLILSHHNINQHQIEKIIKKELRTWRVGVAKDIQENPNPKSTIYPDSLICGFDIAIKKIEKNINEIEDQIQKEVLEKIKIIADEVMKLIDFVKNPQELPQWINAWESFIQNVINLKNEEWIKLKNSFLFANSYQISETININQDIWFKLLNQQLDSFDNEYHQAQFGINGCGIKIYPFLPDHITPAKISIVMGLSANAYPKNIIKPFFYLGGDSNPDIRDNRFERSLALLQVILATGENVAISYVEGNKESPQMPSFVIEYLQEFLANNNINLPTDEFEPNNKSNNILKKHISKNSKKIKKTNSPENNYNYLWKIKINSEVFKSNINSRINDQQKISKYEIINYLSNPIKSFVSSQLKYSKIIIDQEISQSPDDAGSRFDFASLFKNWIYNYAEQNSHNIKISIKEYCEQLSSEGKLPFSYVGDKTSEKLIKVNQKFLEILERENLNFENLKIEKNIIEFAGINFEVENKIISNPQDSNSPVQLKILKNNNGIDFWQFWLDHLFRNSANVCTSLSCYYDESLNQFKQLKLIPKDKKSLELIFKKLERLYLLSNTQLVPFHPNICQELFPLGKKQNPNFDSFEIPDYKWFSGISHFEEDQNFYKIWQAGLAEKDVITQAKSLIKEYWGQVVKDFNE